MHPCCAHLGVCFDGALHTAFPACVSRGDYCCLRLFDGRRLAGRLGSGRRASLTEASNAHESVYWSGCRFEGDTDPGGIAAHTCLHVAALDATASSLARISDRAIRRMRHAVARLQPGTLRQSPGVWSEISDQWTFYLR